MQEAKARFSEMLRRSECLDVPVYNPFDSPQPE